MHTLIMHTLIMHTLIMHTLIMHTLIMHTLIMHTLIMHTLIMHTLIMHTLTKAWLVNFAIVKENILTFDHVAQKTGTFTEKEDNLDCNLSHIVRLISCKAINKQYIGNYITRFRIRFNNYRCFHRKFCYDNTVNEVFFHAHFEKGWVSRS